MADRKLYISFPDKNVRGIIDLYWDDAPKTCATLWDAMARPFRVPTLHAMFAGPEIMMGLPPEAQTFDPMSIPNENQTCFASAGELLWFYQGKNAMKGLPEELWEIGLFYDDGGADIRAVGLDAVQHLRAAERGAEGVRRGVPVVEDRGDADGGDRAPCGVTSTFVVILGEGRGSTPFLACGSRRRGWSAFADHDVVGRRFTR